MRPYKYRELIRIIKRYGFELKRSTGGSHEICWNEERKKTCVVPYHKEIKSGTMKSILAQTGLREKDFEK